MAAWSRQSALTRPVIAFELFSRGKRAPSALVSRPGEPRLVFDYPCEPRWPHSIVAVAREGFGVVAT